LELFERIVLDTYVAGELRCSVIVSVDVTPHRFILIGSGMRIPSASVYQPPPGADAQNAKNDHQSDPLDRASYHDNPISTSFCEAEAAGVCGFERAARFTGQLS
jgi:hypothetical protein